MKQGLRSHNLANASKCSLSLHWPAAIGAAFRQVKVSAIHLYAAHLAPLASVVNSNNNNNNNCCNFNLAVSLCYTIKYPLELSLTSTFACFEGKLKPINCVLLEYVG